MPQQFRRTAWRFNVWALLVPLTIGFLAVAGSSNAADRKQQTAAVLAVNSEFYRAFRESDIAAMDAVWGRRGVIAVQHPSSGRIEGRRNVMLSWARILLQPPNISCTVEAVKVGPGRATVDCLEHLNPGEVRMRNVFHREDGAWKMIYHGPLPDSVS